MIKSKKYLQIPTRSFRPAKTRRAAELELLSRPESSAASPERFYPPEVLARLRDVQQRHDPERIIHAGHDCAAAAS
jgi:hypothetical protein